MPIEFSLNGKPNVSATIRHQERVEAEVINLFFRQSQLGVAGTLLNAAALVFLLRSQVHIQYLSTWFGGMVLIVVIRTILAYQFQHRQLSFQQAKKWCNWNIIVMAVTGLLWALTMLHIFPVQSLIHQLFVGFILCGVMTGSANMYSGMPLVFKAFTILPVFFLVIRLLSFNDVIHFVLAGLSCLYLALMILTTQNFSRTNRQLMSAKVELADRVVERTQALEAANRSLKKEINERLKIEERLRQERDRLELITTTIGAGLAVISKNYNILWANRVFTETFGELQGQPCYKAYSHSARNASCYSCGARLVFEQGRDKTIHEQQILDADGNPLWFQIVTTPICDTDGQISAVLELVLPITERKLAEVAQHRMAERLEEARKTQAIATLAGGIAHQFNNALAIISGNVELLKHDYPYDTLISSYVEPMSSASGRMAQLTNQLLAYAKGGKYNEHPNDIGAVAKTTLNLIKHTIPARITVSKLFDAGLAKINIDVTQIQMVISAIVANAAEAITEKGVITIACFSEKVTSYDYEGFGDVPSGDYVVLSVMDNGSGMSERILKRVFEPFFSTKFQGRGLGMAAVYGIVKNHGGYIRITSESEKGTDVRIYFPPSQKGDLPQHCIADRDFQISGTALLIEDDAEVANINQIWLKRMGFEVITAMTAARAIQEISRSLKIIDLILLDLVLPDMGGAAILPYIKQHQPSAKVIVSSGYGLEDPGQELFDSGVDGFLQKPYTLSDLNEKVAQVLPSQRNDNEDIDVRSV